MMDKLEEYLRKQNDMLLENFNYVKEKYLTIWEYYNSHMKDCIRECKNDVMNDLTGPQGIYWIGLNTKIFIIGKENIGWFDNEFSEESTMFKPIEFAYYVVRAMPNYWSFVKELIQKTINPEIYEKPWIETLQYVSFSNACKCMSEGKTNQERLLCNCVADSSYQYIRKEIEVVNSKVNLLFTRNYRVLEKIYNEESISQVADEIDITRHEDMVLIETRHPVRASDEWKRKVIEIVKANLQ